MHWDGEGRSFERRGWGRWVLEKGERREGSRGEREGGGGVHARSFPAEQCTRMGVGEEASVSRMVRNGSHWLSGEPAASRMLR